MRIVIDLQSSQTASRFRGIGRYGMALTRALLRNAGTHDIWLVINGNLDESARAVRSELAALLPPARIRVFSSPTRLPEFDRRHAARSDAAHLVREHFIARLQPDAVLIISLFESYYDGAVVSIGRFTDPGRTATVQHDLIPLLQPERYLGSKQDHAAYMDKIASLKRAALVLAISDYSRQEAIDHLALDPTRVVTISSSVDESLVAVTVAPEQRQALLDRFGIDRAMLLCAPGGYDVRKNLPTLISAYGLLPAALRSAHQLVIASRLTDDNRASLLAHARANGLQDGELILTGYVSDADLVALYQSAKLFVFPSLHEGFGLPALEAMAFGAPVIGADNTGLTEVIGLQEALFDGTSVNAMAAKIAEVLGNPAMLDRLREHGRVHAAGFSFDASARRALAAMEANSNALGPAPTPPSQADLVAAIAALPGLAHDREIALELAFCLAAMPDLAMAPKVLAHTSSLVLSDTGGTWHYRHAGANGRVADLHPGDIVTGIDVATLPVQLAAADGLYAHLFMRGIGLHLHADTSVLAMPAPGRALADLIACAALVTCTGPAVEAQLRTWCTADAAAGHGPRFVQSVDATLP